MKQNRQNIQISILDRLVDYEPSSSREPVQLRFYRVGQIKSSVIKDMENLLNTRRNILHIPIAFGEVNNSVYVYGLKDFTAQNPKSPIVKQQLRLNVEKTILQFEPRLKNVTVHLEEITEHIQSIRFRITALLVVEPITEPVTFDTYFDINRGEYIVSE